jgi:hypothetical protein
MGLEVVHIFSCSGRSNGDFVFVYIFQVISGSILPTYTTQQYIR